MVQLAWECEPPNSNNRPPKSRIGRGVRHVERTVKNLYLLSWTTVNYDYRNLKAEQASRYLNSSGQNLRGKIFVALTTGKFPFSPPAGYNSCHWLFTSVFSPYSTLIWFTLRQTGHPVGFIRLIALIQASRPEGSSRWSSLSTGCSPPCIFSQGPAA